MALEPIHHPLPGPAQILSDISPVHVSNALIAFLFAASAPIAIVLNIGLKGGLTESDLSSWIFASFVFNGVLGIIASIAYRQPLVFFWTIPGSVLVGPALTHLSFPEIIGAFLGTGVLLMILGLSGSVKKITSYLPMPIVMAMVAGVFLQFGLDWIQSLFDAPLIAGSMTAVFVLLSLNAKVAAKLPPMIGVLVVGILAVVLTGSFDPEAEIAFELASPNFYVPEFSAAAMVELVVPLAVTVLAAQNAQGIAILTNRGYTPPINTITGACGAWSIFAGLFGSVSTCLTGPVNAILSSSDDKNGQYTAAICICLMAILFGIYAPTFTKFLLATPPAFIATLAGLALIRILQSAFVVSFSGKFTFGALISFLVTLAGEPIFNIGAPFWGLVFGFITSWLMEKDDFKPAN